MLHTVQMSHHEKDICGRRTTQIINYCYQANLMYALPCQSPVIDAILSITSNYAVLNFQDDQ
jgi:hypothetical protein